MVLTHSLQLESRNAGLAWLLRELAVMRFWLHTLPSSACRLSVGWNAAAAAIAKTCWLVSRITRTWVRGGGRSPTGRSAQRPAWDCPGALASRPSAQFRPAARITPDYASIDADAPTLPFEELADDS